MSRVTHERPRPRLSSAAWVLGFLVIGGGVALLARPPATPPPAPRAASAPVDTRTAVEIGVQVSPPGLTGLELSIGGVVVTPLSPHRVVPRATGPLTVKVSAPGYRSADVAVTPDRDRTVMLTLVPIPPAVQAADAGAAKPTRAPAVAPSGVIRRYPF